MVQFCFGFNTDIVMSMVAITAMAGPGTMIRVSIQHLTAKVVILIPSLLPNLFGCMIMGFHEGFAQSRSDKYVKAGIATGLAGSITTFSSFNNEINSLIITNEPQFGLYIASIAATFIGGIILYFLGELLALAIFSTKKIEQEILHNKPKNGFKNGYKSQTKTSISTTTDMDEATQIELEPIQNGFHDNDEEDDKKYDIKTQPLKLPKDVHLNNEETNMNNASKSTWHLRQDYDILILWTVIFCVMYGICIPCSFLINDYLWEGILLSPFGALSRWYLGKVFNKSNHDTIPFGTFIANICGSVLFTILYVLSAEKDDILWRYWESAFAGLLTGFCGCLTTVSSFVHEKFKLKRNATTASKAKLKQEVLSCEHEFITYKISVIYFFLTLIVAQTLSSIINAIDVFAFGNP